MHVIYVCCFASVMRKQVNYHPLDSIYDPYGRKVRPLFVYPIRSKVMRVSKFRNCVVTLSDAPFEPETLNLCRNPSNHTYCQILWSPATTYL